MIAETIVSIALLVAGLYLAIGFPFALAFAARGAARIDPSARGATWGFKLLILPAGTVLWPLLARRWWRGVEEPPEECSPHRRAAGGCGCGRPKE